MESIKSFLGNPYYLMTAVLAIAAFGFAATAVISLIQERKQKKEETQLKYWTFYYRGAIRLQ